MLNSAGLALTGAAPSAALSPILGPLASIGVGATNAYQGGMGLIDGEWNHDDWANAGKLGGGLAAVTAGGLGLGVLAAGGAAAAPYLAGGAAVAAGTAAAIGAGVRGNNFMNEHLGFGYGDMMGYGIGESAGSSIAEFLGAEEDGFVSDAAGVVGGSLATIGSTLGVMAATGGVVNPLTVLGAAAGAGIAEDVGSLLFGEDNVDSAIDWAIGDDSFIGGAIDGAADIGGSVVDGITSLWGD